ncbi:MAG: hypothetical protein GY788_16410 [bacterium]|nr:hypothetical protein [bacterium]
MSPSNPTNDLARLADCSCGVRHLVSNIRFMASTARDGSGAADLNFTDCDCVCCQWLDRITT